MGKRAIKVSENIFYNLFREGKVVDSTTTITHGLPEDADLIDVYLNPGESQVIFIYESASWQDETEGDEIPEYPILIATGTPAAQYHPVLVTWSGTMPTNNVTQRAYSTDFSATDVEIFVDNPYDFIRSPMVGFWDFDDGERGT